MKTLYLLITCFIFAFTSYGQTIKNDYRDEFTGNRILRMEAAEIYSEKPDVEAFLKTGYVGGVYYFLFYIYTPKGLQIRYGDKIYGLLDGEKWKGVLQKEYSEVIPPNTIGEIYKIELDRKTYVKFAKAKSIRVRIDTHVFKFSDVALNSIKVVRHSTN